MYNFCVVNYLGNIVSSVKVLYNVICMTSVSTCLLDSIKKRVSGPCDYVARLATSSIKSTVIPNPCNLEKKNL